MESRLQRRVQRYGWDKASSCYELFWQNQLKPAQDFLIEMTGLMPEDDVLDIACGTGLVTFQILGKPGFKGRLLGIDISDKMVEFASSTAALNNEDRVQFQQMDGEELGLENDSFDLTVCAMGLMYMPDPQKALQEMFRVLRPGGRAVVAVWGRRDQCGWADIFEIVDQHVEMELCPMFFNLGNPRTLRLNLKSAGFRKIIVQRVDTVLSYKDRNDALRAAFDGGPVALAYDKFSDEIKHKVQIAYLDSIAPFKRGIGYEIPGEFVIARGIVI
jgi:ubiquinone/menaquinone biosynthesis C-methylase UbiE